MSDKLAIAYAVDDSVDCFLQLVASINSVRKVLGRNIDIFILTNKNKVWMRRLHEVSFIDVTALSEKFKLGSTGLSWRNNSVPAMLLARLLIPIIPQLNKYDKVLYLDTDTEIWDDKVFDLVNADNTHEIIAVNDSISARKASRRMRQLMYDENGELKEGLDITKRWVDIVDRKEAYVNSGILVFNMHRFGPGYEDRLKHILDMLVIARPYYSDQDMLNAYYDLHVVHDRRYNGWSYDSCGAHVRHYVGNERKRHGEYPQISIDRPNVELDSVAKNERLGELSGIVDHVYILQDSTADRCTSIKKWLTDNNIVDVTYIDTKNTNMYSGLIDICPSDNIAREHLDTWVGHYRVVCDAIDKGYDKVLILEDSFDPNDIITRLKKLNPDFDLAICDGSKDLYMTWKYFAVSSKCFIAGRRCLFNLVRLFDTVFDDECADRRLRYVHKWLYWKILGKLRTYISY